MPNQNHAPPRSTRESRMRYVQLLKVEAELIDPPGTKYPTPPRPTTQAQRRRIVEVLHLEAGLPLPDWKRMERGRDELIDVAPIKAAWDAIQNDRQRRYDVLGLSLENHGSRVRCRRCGDMLMDVPHGLVGITPSAIYIQHAQRTGCHA
jgi:hypothetical protein